MEPIAGGVLIVAGLVLAQGVLAMAVAALEGANRSRMKEWAARGDRGAAAAIRLGEDPRRFAPAFQAGIAMLGNLAGVYAGARLQPGLSRALGSLGPLSAHRDAIALAVLVLILTPATLMAVDLIPRRVAPHRPEAIARLVARPGRALAMLLGPLAGLLGSVTDRLLRVASIRPAPEAPVTGEAIQELMREGARAGVFEPAEHEMVRRALRFGDRRARALMTPRNDIVWIDTADSPEEIRRKVIASPHSRFLVCDQSLDNLLGIVHVKDLLGQGPDVEPFRLKGRLTLPAFLYEGTHGLKILETLRSSGTHHAVVLDEYGTVQGLVTLTDILAAILGDIPDRSDEEAPRAVHRPDGSWLLDGRLPLDDVRDLLDRPSLPGGDFSTLAGLVVAHLGHIPRAGERFEAWGLRVEVSEMDGNRVDRLLIARADRGGGA